MFDKLKFLLYFHLLIKSENTLLYETNGKIWLFEEFKGNNYTLQPNQIYDVKEVHDNYLMVKKNSGFCKIMPLNEDYVWLKGQLLEDTDSTGGFELFDPQMHVVLTKKPIIAEAGMLKFEIGNGTIINVSV